MTPRPPSRTPRHLRVLVFVSLLAATAFAGLGAVTRKAPAQGLPPVPTLPVTTPVANPALAPLAPLVGGQCSSLLGAFAIGGLVGGAVPVEQVGQTITLGANVVGLPCGFIPPADEVLDCTLYQNGKAVLTNVPYDLSVDGQIVATTSQLEKALGQDPTLSAALGDNLSCVPRGQQDTSVPTPGAPDPDPTSDPEPTSPVTDPPVSDLGDFGSTPTTPIDTDVVDAPATDLPSVPTTDTGTSTDTVDLGTTTGSGNGNQQALAVPASSERSSGETFGLTLLVIAILAASGWWAAKS